MATDYQAESENAFCRVPTIMLLLIIIVFPCFGMTAEAAAAKGTSNLSAGLPPGTSAEWMSAVLKTIQEEDYHLAWQKTTRSKKSKGTLQATNRAQRMKTYFTEKGVRVVPLTQSTPDWSWGLTLSGYGYQGNVRPVEAPLLVHAKNRIEYHRGQGLKEWYLNDRRGLEQGFTLSEPLVGGSSEIVIRMTLQGNLSGALNSSKDNIDFITPDGACVLRYGHLHVQDAAGLKLPASIALNDRTVDILVDTRNARYPVTIDPLATSPAWIAETEQVASLFGHSVSTAGDVNGDGYSDVIVGAHFFNGGQMDEGRAYVFHGSASGPSATPAWTAESDDSSAYFGFCVSTAGDVNGDGYDDVIIGSTKYLGRAYVFHGSASGLSAAPDWYAESGQVLDHFGGSVSTAGDVNGDGYDDVIIGATNYDGGLEDEGRVWVFHGSASGLSTTADWYAESGQADAHFGSSVSTAGDVNGDGYSDVIVGAPYYSGGQVSEGRAYVFHGSASGITAASAWVVESNLANIRFGCSVSTAGDINGDGYSDVIIGATVFENGQPFEGRAYAFHGSGSGLSTAPAWTAESNKNYAYYGDSVATAGDVNGDGYCDVIVGAKNYDVSQTSEGRVDVFYGSASGLSAAPDWTAEADDVSQGFGVSVSTAGDVNGDGYSDVIIGASYFGGEYPSVGRAFLFLGQADGLTDFLSPILFILLGD